MIVITTQCFPPDPGGIEELMGGLARHLSGAGRKVEVFADSTRESRMRQGMPSPYHVHRFSGWKPWRRRRKVFALRQALKRNEVAGVFADSWKSVELLPNLDVPVAVLAHGMEFPVSPGATKKKRIRRAFTRATVVIANSEYTANLARPYLSVGTRLEVIHPPIGPQPEPPEAEQQALQERVAGRGPLLLTLSRLEPRKGVDMVIRALPALLQQHPDLLYIVAGRGADRERLERLATELGVTDSIYFAGAVNGAEKAALFSGADVFAMPARRVGNSVEGFGIVYREANWYGVPALAGCEGGAVDAVLDGETGLLCDGSDPDDVQRQLLRLLGDSDLRYRLGKNAALLARGPGQWQQAVARFLSLL